MTDQTATASPPYRGYQASHFDAALQQVARNAAAQVVRAFEQLLGDQAASCPGTLAVETGQDAGLRTWRVMIPVDLVFDPYAFAKEKR